jgi:hypothetical protein
VFFVRYFCLLFGAILVSSCSQSLGQVPTSGAPPDPSIRLGGSEPAITKVSAIKAKQYQKIVISGSGFGTMKPYNGDSDYLQIWDKTGSWSAGLDNDTQDDSVWLDVTSWSGSKIVIKGFTGDYGESYWVLHKGDRLEINVWNAQSHNGPATTYKKVK